MAKNYSIAEATQIIVEGQDKEQMADIGRRFPLLAQILTKIGTKSGEDFIEFMSYMPEHLSANKLNSSIKKSIDGQNGSDDVDDVDDDEDVDANEKKPTKKVGRGRPAKTKKEDTEDEDTEDVGYDYDSMNNAKMYKLLGELGKRKDCKDKFGDLSHDSMLKYLKKYGPKVGDEMPDDESEDEEAADDYTGKSAVELYKLCKSRKIKAEQKKPAKYYVELLKKADAEAAKSDDDAEDEEWDDDDEAPKKKSPAKEKKAAKKPVKSEEPKDDDDDDDDDEWDI